MSLPLLTQSATAQSKFKTLYKFTGDKDGGSPAASLVFDAARKLYGTTQFGGAFGGGVVFRLTPKQDGSWRESVLHSFCSRSNCSDGLLSSANLVLDDTGSLYGTTERGGDSSKDFGVVFKLTPQSNGRWTEMVLHVFEGNDGASPIAGLIFDQTGNLYGTTRGGGQPGGGVVFRLSPNQDGSWTEQVLYNFTNGTDGGGPDTNLIFDQNGNLYGTACCGGNNNGAGVAFKLTPNQDGTWSESVLYTFCSLTQCSDGADPQASLVFDAAGNLYSTTRFGGANKKGVVFRLSPNSDGSWSESVLHSFCSRSNCSDGSSPYAGLIVDSEGSLYGTTREGGSGRGVAFKLVPNSKGGWDEKVLHTFQGISRSNPETGLIFDTTGNLYGTTGGDGFDALGLAFEITP
jgi:uncharacterized repeat protein (TIGR03803 family)